MNYTFADAIARLTTGKACKRPSWRGYVKRVDGTSGAYQYVFVKPGTTDPTTYTFNVSSTGVITTSDTLTMDVDLFAAMIATDWTIGNTTDFETVLAGTGAW